LGNGNGDGEIILIVSVPRFSVEIQNIKPIIMNRKMFIVHDVSPFPDLVENVGFKM
jgi:hypothetical protein